MFRILQNPPKPFGIILCRLANKIERASYGRKIEIAVRAAIPRSSIFGKKWAKIPQEPISYPIDSIPA